MHHDATGTTRGDAGAHRDALAPLGSLPGFQLAAGEPDIRGWDLLTLDGRRVGIVEELLVDRRTDEISALAVRMHDGMIALPLSEARVDVRQRAVFAELAPERLASMARGAADARSSAGPTAGHPGVTVERTASGEEIVRVPIVEEELVVERRPVVKEVVVIRKRAVQDDHVIEADLRRERLEVDRSEPGDPRQQR